jgi:hypothetical protein
MAFTGTGLVEEVSDSVVRVTGVSLAPGAVGTISLHGGLIPFHGLVPDIRLPAEFQPADYASVTLQASIQVWFNLVFNGGADFVIPISLAKSGTTPRDFLIAVANMTGTGAAGYIGTSFPFGVMAAVAVNNTNVTGITGDVGVWPGAIVTGFPPGTASGAIHLADATAEAAIRDATAALRSHRRSDQGQRRTPGGRRCSRRTSPGRWLVGRCSCPGAAVVRWPCSAEGVPGQPFPFRGTPRA